MGWLSAAASIGGALLSKKSSDDDRDAQMEQNALNYEQQKEFAKNSIQWKAADARAAGLHPLFAMGAPLTSYSPSSFTPVGDGGSATALASAGRALDGAISQREVESASKKRLVTQQRFDDSMLRQNQMKEELMKVDLQKAQFELQKMQTTFNNQNPSGNPVESFFKQQMNDQGDKKNYPTHTSVDDRNMRFDEPGLVKRLEPHYGDEVSQIPGFIKMAQDYIQHFLPDPEVKTTPNHHFISRKPFR
jgi:hypothetical protein